MMVFISLHVAHEVFSLFLNILDRVFNLKCLKAQEDCLKIGEEGSWRDDHDALFKCVLDEVASINLNCTNVLRDEIMVDPLSRNEHECKVCCPLLRLNVL